MHDSPWQRVQMNNSCVHFATKMDYSRQHAHIKHIEYIVSY